MKNLASRVFAAIEARELILLVGLAAVGYGAGSVYLPAGFFVPGAVLLFVAINGTRS